MKSKKISILVIVVVLVVTACVAFGVILFQNEKNHQSAGAGEFTLSDYQKEIDAFPCDKNVGKVDNRDAAIEKAKQLWQDEDHTVNEKSGNSENGGKVKVSYDSKGKCWLIYTTLDPNIVGGTPHAIIRKSGKAVAVWFEK